MSNKIVPQIYRAIIDDVIANVSVDFEEYGMDDELLPLLQAKWESKLLKSDVATFTIKNKDKESESSNAGGPSDSAAPPAGPPANGPSNGVQVKAEPEDHLRLRGGASEEIKPNISLDEVAPQSRPEPNAAGLLPGDEVIDSDLDDSDDELGIDDDEEDGDADPNIVYCVYDKVQRVKNKWKTVFKDGMIHINGKDYLFTKCQGEFEW